MPSKYCFAIDAREVTARRAGKGRYVVGLLRGFAEINDPTVHWVVYSKEAIPDDVILPAQTERVILPRYSVPGLRPIWLANDLRRRQIDALLSPTGFLPAILSPIPTAIVVHDLAVWKAPNHPRSVMVQEKGQLGLATRRAGKIVVVSHHTGHDLQELFAVPATKLVYAPNAADSVYHPFEQRNATDQTALRRVKTTYQLPADYLLFVGTLEPRKNLPRLVEAYHQLPKTTKQRYPLLVIGKKGWGFDAIFDRVKELHEEETVRFLGYVPDHDLPALYAAATLAVYPSLYEGFGLPPVEAMACGTPLLTSNTSSLPEVVGEAAVMVDPTDVSAIRDGLAVLLADPNRRAELSRLGPAQARKFNWRTTAETVLGALKDLASTS